MAQDLDHASNESWQAFKGLPNEDTSFKKVVHIKDLVIIIEGSQDVYAQSRGAAGYADLPNKIWIRGVMVNGKIIPFEAGLGHELAHVLNFADPEVINPDRIKELLLKGD